MNARGITIPETPGSMYEHFFQCPYCWETISMLLDPSVPEQTYVEDCEICCNPLEISPVFEDETLVSCEVSPLGQ